MTAALALVLAASLLVLAAAWAMQPPEPDAVAGPEIEYPGRHREPLQIGQTSWTFLISFFFWVGWVVFGVPLTLLAWMVVDELRVKLAARNERILRERQARRA